MPSSLMQSYREKHRQPVNKLLHTIGIPMIAISLPLFFFNWRAALALFTGGWIRQFVGHFIKGNQPAFLHNPSYLLIGLLWFLRRIGEALHLVRPAER